MGTTSSSPPITPPLSSSGVPSFQADSKDARGTSSSSSSSSSTVTITIQPQTQDLVMSDSEISVLDLGPSINEQASRSGNPKLAKKQNKSKDSASKDKVSSGDQENKPDAESDGSTSPYEPESRPTSSRQSSGSSTRKRAYVGKAIRTISSPLLSPLKYSMGRPGVNRAKTSFRAGEAST